MDLFKQWIGKQRLLLLRGGTTSYDTFSSKFRGRGDSSYPSYMALPEDVRHAIDTIAIDRERFKHAEVRYFNAFMPDGSSLKTQYVVIGETQEGKEWFVEHPSDVTGNLSLQVLKNVRQKLDVPYLKAAYNNGFWTAVAGCLFSLCVAWAIYPQKGYYVPYPILTNWVVGMMLGFAIVSLLTPFVMTAKERYKLRRAFDANAHNHAVTTLSSVFVSEK